MVKRLLALPGLPGTDAADALGLAITHAHAGAAPCRDRPRRRRSSAAPRTVAGRYKAARLLTAHRRSATAACRRRLGDNRRPMYALFDDAGKFHAGRVMSEADSSMQVELGSGKRVKVKAANVLLQLRQARSPAELLAEAQALAARDRSRPGLGVRARGRVRLRRPGARLLRRQGRRRRSRPRRCSACSRRRTTSAALGKGLFRKAPEEIVQGGAARHRAQEAGRGADRRLGRRAGRPAAARRRSASSSTRSCSSPTRTRPSTRRWSRRRGARRRAPLDLLQGGRRDRLARTSSTGGASCSSTSRRAPASRRSPAPAIKDDAAAGRGAGLLDRRLGHHRDRRRAVGAGPGQRHGHVRHPHRRAGAGDRARHRRSTRSRASACPPSTCRATS